MISDSTIFSERFERKSCHTVTPLNVFQQSSPQAPAVGNPISVYFNGFAKFETDEVCAAITSRLMENIKSSFNEEMCAV